MKKSIVVAYDKNHGIGAYNDLLWMRDLPADLKHFKDLTTGNAIIMGRKTYDSIGRPLPNRQSIVITRDPKHRDDIDYVDSLKAAYDAVEPGRDAFVIGGGQIYSLAMDSVDTIYATEVDASFPEADVFFPEVSPEVWHEVSREHYEADDRNKYAFDFVTYVRR